MTSNKQKRKVFRGMEAQVELHRQKVANELSKPFPNLDRIHYWEKEIDRFVNQIAKKQ